MSKTRKRWLRIAALICLVGVGLVIYRILPIPDGQIAYETIKGRACLVNGLRTRCIVPQTGVSSPSDPDPSFLDFYEFSGLLEIGGVKSTALTEVAVAPYLSPRWSPDQRVVAYTNRDHTDICIADIQSGEVRCYQSEWKCVGGLSWSPDGEQIAFDALSTHEMSEEDCSSDVTGWTVYLLDVDTFSSRVLVTDAYFPSWSPDGQQIAFTSSIRDNNTEIYTVNIDGSVVQRITHNPATDFAPAWSPDGEKIAFLSDRGPGSVRVNLFDIFRKLRVYVIDAEGGHARLLLSRPSDSIERFVWRE